MASRFLRRGVRWPALLAAVSLQSASAQIIYGTGVDNAHNQISGSSIDPHYTLTLNGSTVAAVAMSDGNLWSQWPRPADARWIYNQDVFDSGIRGLATFTTTFDLTGFDPSTASLSGNWAADQYGSIYLNGNSTGISLGDGNWTQLNSFLIGSGFVAGTNILEFKVQMPDGGDALIVSGLNLTAQAVPEPMACASLAGGAALLATAVRRRFRR